MQTNKQLCATSPDLTVFPNHLHKLKLDLPLDTAQGQLFLL